MAVLYMYIYIVTISHATQSKGPYHMINGPAVVVVFSNQSSQSHCKPHNIISHMTIECVLFAEHPLWVQNILCGRRTSFVVLSKSVYMYVTRLDPLSHMIVTRVCVNCAINMR